MQLRESSPLVMLTGCILGSGLTVVVTVAVLILLFGR